MQKVFNKIISLFWTGENPKRLPNPILSYWNWHLIGKLHDQKLVHFFRNCVLFFIAVFSYVPVDPLLTCNELNYRSISWNYSYTCYLIGHLSPRGKGGNLSIRIPGSELAITQIPHWNWQSARRLMLLWHTRSISLMLQAPSLSADFNPKSAIARSDEGIPSDKLIFWMLFSILTVIIQNYLKSENNATMYIRDAHNTTVVEQNETSGQPFCDELGFGPFQEGGLLTPCFNDMVLITGAHIWIILGKVLPM